MEGISTVLESGVRDRLLERMVMLGMSKFDTRIIDTRIIDLGIPKHKLQSMWRNTTGDVPGIILEKMCKAFPELDAVYICSGIENGNDEERIKKEAVLELCLVACVLGFAAICIAIPRMGDVDLDYMGIIVGILSLLSAKRIRDDLI